MLHHIQNAILQGDFEQAAHYFDDLLDKDPTQREFVGGFYACRFWANRQELIRLESEGRPRAFYLMREWEKFETEAARRGLSDLPVVELLMRHIFHVAAQNLRTVFHREGSRSVNYDFLVHLGMCLLKAGDYQNCLEVLEYARSQDQGTALLYFYLGETYYRQGDADKSRMFYREALYLGGELSPKLATADFYWWLWQETQRLEIPSEYRHDYMFLYGVSWRVLNIMRPLRYDEVEAALLDIRRLEAEYQKVAPAIRPRLEVHLLKKYLYLMDYFEYHRKDTASFAELGDRVRRLDEGLYKQYIENKQRAF